MKAESLSICLDDLKFFYGFQPTNLANVFSQVDLSWASLIVLLVKNPPAVQETPVRFLVQEDPLEKG